MNKVNSVEFRVIHWITYYANAYAKTHKSDLEDLQGKLIRIVVRVLGRDYLLQSLKGILNWSGLWFKLLASLWTGFFVGQVLTGQKSSKTVRSGFPKDPWTMIRPNMIHYLRNPDRISDQAN